MSMKRARPQEEPLGLRERKRAALKLRIAQTTLALVQERGYEQTTIDEIVRRVEISQPTFYKYYPSKDAILLEHATAGFAPLLLSAMAASSSTTLRLRGFFVGVAKQITKQRELWQAIALSNAYNPVRDPQLFHAANATNRVLEAAIEQGQQEGEFTRRHSARKLASMLEAMMLRTCLEWGANYPSPHRLPESVIETFDFFIHAAAP